MRTPQNYVKNADTTEAYFNKSHLLRRVRFNYVDFLQFQRYFTPQAELEEAFIYIIHKPIDFSIDFSCRLRSYGHWLETCKSANRNLVPSPSTKNHLLSLSELADRK